MEAYKTYIPPVKRGFYLDPRTKILFMVFISTIMFFVYDNIGIDIAIVSIAIFLLVSNKNYKTATIYGILFVLAVISSKTKNMYELPSILNMINVLLNSLVIRLFPIFMMGYYTISSTKPNEFISALEKWKIPEAFIIPVSVVFRFIPTLNEENQAISNAMRMRGIRFNSKKTKANPSLFLEYRIIPLLFSVVKIGDELSASALTRGLDNVQGRTSLVEVKFRKYDFLIFLLMIGLLVWALV
ncbi:energy-coupling factor transporter transmembrane component T [Aedoeadaptatus acetigenes]|uniref:energy-coupling factor transporter transmembrane component T n=1 Tax=Aedoeadaptatus acetigenes TaxID=2981723 RepID=UPI0011DCA5E3|nr:energy-coupling factor transporter transmembrane component T [Aedoeadaptatus acetigenes]MCU6785773.1 energy-coupling factor transporter transmembrane protein EcfT [Aedoeadaptatus acetigenes]